MNKKNFFEGGGIYVAPEIEVISVAAECGVGVSGDINGVIGDDTGDLDEINH